MLDTKSNSGISWITFSNLSVTNCSILSGLAPGKYVVINDVRITKPGSSACGN
jgi:hypothetical protein